MASILLPLKEKLRAIPVRSIFLSLIEMSFIVSPPIKKEVESNLKNVSSLRKSDLPILYTIDRI